MLHIGFNDLKTNYDNVNAEDLSQKIIIIAKK